MFVIGVDGASPQRAIRQEMADMLCRRKDQTSALSLGAVIEHAMMSVAAMYRIPWTKDDNPNGWVEATTQCRLTPELSFFKGPPEDGNSGGRRMSSDTAHGSRQALDYPIVSIVDSPQLLADGRDLCDSCPDAILSKGELVPICILDEIKNGLQMTIQR